MTRESFEQKVSAMLTDLDIQKYAKKAIDKAYSAMDVEGAEDNFMLPKAFLTAMFRELAFQCEPSTDEGKADAKNIGMFL
ncbi:MAG: hypothetical protein KGJ13_02055 [Patescibacteria group bacterium]|nr:hypothetical protein [Patescibacteria group bacterium]